jgi:competence protein ComEA
MGMRSDHKALLFLGVVAVLGAGVRVVRAANGRAATGVQPALDQQSRAADSAARAGRGERVDRAKGQGRGSGAKQNAAGRSPRPSRDSINGVDTPARVRAAGGLLDHPGYIGGKLDLDVATAAQIDSLPGVTPAMAKRIVLDRMKRGPFVTRDGLRRVAGVGPVFVAKIDSFVIFSGTVRFPTDADTVIPRAGRPRGRTE